MATTGHRSFTLDFSYSPKEANQSNTLNLHRRVAPGHAIRRRYPDMWHLSELAMFGSVPSYTSATSAVPAGRLRTQIFRVACLLWFIANCRSRIT